MKIIDGKTYTERQDLEKKVLGIEQYKPGHKSVKNIFIRFTSGTTRGLPVVLMVRIIFNKILLKFYDFSKPLILMFSKNDHNFQWLQTTLNNYPKSPRVLTLTRKDIEHPLIRSVIDDFQPEVIRSTVSLLNFFIDKLCRRRAVFPKHIQKIYMNGERPSGALLNKIKEMFPKGEAHLTYGMSEIGVIGIDCGYLTKKYIADTSRSFHPVQRVSIVGPDRAGVGEILLTTPELNDYLTGDAGKIIKEECRCGARETLIHYGRIDYDIVNCVGAVFHRTEVERVFSYLGDYVKDYFLEIRDVFERGKTIGSVTIKVVPTGKLQTMENGTDFVCEFVKKHLQLSKTRCLRDLLSDGIFLPPKTVFVSSFPVSGKKIRMKKM